MADTATKPKSIINSKYRGRAKTADFVSGLIDAASAKTQVVEKKVDLGDGKHKMVKQTVPAGIDVGGLFELGQRNSLPIDKFQSQTGTHGFAGRFRMTVANMLRAAARKRHGLFDAKGKWVEAPVDWLVAQGATGDATQDRKGVSTVPVKAPAVKAAPAAKAPKAVKAAKKDKAPATVAAE